MVEQADARPVDSDVRDSITTPIKDGLSDLIFGNPGLFEDRPGFIAGPPSGNPFTDTVRGISQANCRLWAAADKSNYSPRVNNTNSNLCKPYLEDIGEWPGDGELGEPFEGGQCDAQIYLIEWSYEQGPEFAPQTTTVFSKAFGPIGGAQEGENSSQQPGVGLVTRGGLNRTSGGAYACGGLFPVTLGPLQYRQFATNARSPKIVSVSPCGLDDCGNPDPIYRPPPRVPPTLPRPAPVVINPPGFPPLNVNVDLDPEGQPIICFEELDTCITVTPPGGGGGGGGGDGNPNPTDPGAPGDGGDTGSGGATNGEGEEGQELVGVLVEILSTPDDPNVFSNNAVDVYRGIGYVRMGFPGRLGVDTSASAVVGTQFFHAQQRGLTAWEVRANVGFNLRSTPYYREVTE